MHKATDILKKYWGYDTFRDPQESIIKDVIHNKDVIALLPTGSGKSVCFQVPTLMHKEGVCIVISPLIALMKDQVANLQKRGIKSVAITGFVSQDEIIKIFDNIQFGGIRFLYLSPERVQSSFIQEKLKQLSVVLIAIDEAHCISEWGHDFRPLYLQLSKIRELHPNVNIIALTATATEPVLKDIANYLELKETQLYKKSIIRENLQLQVIDSADKFQTLYHLVKESKESIIIYAGSRNKCKRTSEYLNNKGLKSVYYHAGLSKEVKEKATNTWFNQESLIMVATNAFGMGIDKENVRMVLHTGVPFSIENYTQEAGRAGRDGKLSKAIIIEDFSNIGFIKTSFNKSNPDVAYIKSIYNDLNQYFKIAYGDLPTSIFSFNLSDFCNCYDKPILKTYNALDVLSREKIIDFLTKTNTKSELVFTIKSAEIFSYYSRNPKKEKILKLILRTYDGVFNNKTTINLYKLAKKLNLTITELKKEIKELHNDGIVYYQTETQGASIRFLVPREDNYTINQIARSIKRQAKVKIDKYNSMIDYILNQKTCRNKILSSYFDEKIEENCGICDICMEKIKEKDSTHSNLQETILNLLKSRDLSSKEMIGRLGIDKKTILKILRLMLDTQTIVLTSQNKYQRKNKN
jgi:ATP-dependent DNA helicase RecQ